MSRVVIASVSVALVEDNGRTQIELQEDSQVAKDLPIAGPAIAKVLPAKEVFDLTGGVAAALGAIGGFGVTVRNLFAKK